MQGDKAVTRGTRAGLHRYHGLGTRCPSKSLSPRHTARRQLSGRRETPSASRPLHHPHPGDGQDATRRARGAAGGPPAGSHQHGRAPHTPVSAAPAQAPSDTPRRTSKMPLPLPLNRHPSPPPLAAQGLATAQRQRRPAIPPPPPRRRGAGRALPLFKALGRHPRLWWCSRVA